MTAERVVPGTLVRMIGTVAPEDWGSYEGTVTPTEDLEQANVVTSELVNPDISVWDHAPVIDLDVPVTYVPSSTPGHGHLYIDVPMSADAMWRLLSVMVDVGMVEEGYLNASQARGHTSVRLPWVKKPPAPVTVAEFLEDWDTI